MAFQRVDLFPVTTLHTSAVLPFVPAITSLPFGLNAMLRNWWLCFSQLTNGTGRRLPSYSSSYQF